MKSIFNFECNISEDGEKIHKNFEKFVDQIAFKRLQTNEEEELRIINL